MIYDMLTAVLYELWKYCLLCLDFKGKKHFFLEACSVRMMNRKVGKRIFGEACSLRVMNRRLEITFEFFPHYEGIYESMIVNP